jgi:hypothetical protein
MSRGKPSGKALDAAVTVARARGQVIFLRQYPGAPCDFLIVTTDTIVAVCVRRALRLWSTIDEILTMYQETLGRIRMADHCTSVLCEFWLWSPYGTMRFFRVGDATLAELNLYGLPLHASADGGSAGHPLCSACSPGNSFGNPAEGEERSPLPGAGLFGQKNRGAAGNAPAPPVVREPPYIRYLRKRNAALQGRRNEEALRGGNGTDTGASPVPPGAGNAGTPEP